MTENRIFLVDYDIFNGAEVEACDKGRILPAFQLIAAEGNVFHRAARADIPEQRTAVIDGMPHAFIATALEIVQHVSVAVEGSRKRHPELGFKLVAFC